MPSKTVNVYIVDNDPSLSTVYARVVQSAKMQPRLFSSVEDFMRGDFSDENACVIAEVAMPGTSGVELPTLLACRGFRLPVIFITADDSAESRELARQVGAVAYFRKPIDDQALVDAITWAVAKSRDG